jgi:cellulose synthase/poly-beta-1,6-N-acetylglucosamine synthase-like glycosyltransferase
VISALTWLAYAAHWLLILAWSSCHWQISAAQRRVCRPICPEKRLRLPRVRVVLPARDEAADLEPCAVRLLAQQGIDLALTIVNDRSSDETGRISDGIATRDPRCRVIHNDVLPEGWTGKSHACWLGASDAHADWLLFTDADVRLEPMALASAIDYASANKLDLLSLWPRDASVGFCEKLLIPLCGAMIVIWYGHVAPRSNQRGDAFANGQFLLVRTEAYVACGGHASVRAALIEDIPLARCIAKHGFIAGSAPGPDIAGVRMYRNLRQIVHGWGRIFVGVLTPFQILGCIVSLLCGSVLPMALAPLMLARVHPEGGWDWPAAWLLSASVQLAVLMSVSIRFFRLARCDRRYLLLYPAAVAGVLFILLTALRTHVFKQGVRWRGTIYWIGLDGRLRNQQNPAQ